MMTASGTPEMGVPGTGVVPDLDTNKKTKKKKKNQSKKHVSGDPGSGDTDTDTDTKENGVRIMYDSIYEKELSERVNDKTTYHNNTPFSTMMYAPHTNPNHTAIGAPGPSSSHTDMYSSSINRGGLDDTTSSTTSSGSGSGSDTNIGDNTGNDPFSLPKPDTSVLRKNTLQSDFSNIQLQLKQCNEVMEWPPHTSVYCYNCCHPFQSRPWFLPVEYHNGVFIVHHIFCSPSCVLRYNHESKHYDTHKRKSLLFLMTQLIYKHQQSVQIEMSPPKDILTMFGGSMDIDTYREHSTHMVEPDSDVMLEYPPVYSVIPIVDIKKRVIKSQNPMNYSLYREKPLARSQTSILDVIR